MEVIMSRGAKYFLLVLGIIFVLMIATVVYFSYKLSIITPKAKSDSVLVIELSGEIPEIGPVDPISQYFMKGVLSHDKIISSIKYAAKDKNIKAAVVKLNFPQIGWARAEEIVKALEEFKKSNKKLISYYEVGENIDYYLASAANKIIVPETGLIILNGLHAELPFFKGLLDKIGIEAEMQHIGDYKSASDIFTRDKASEAHIEMMNWLLDSLQNNLIGQIEKSRKLGREKINEIINKGLFTSKEALRLGLVDNISYWDELLRKELKAKDKNILYLSDYYKSIKDEIGGNGKKIALIYAVGSIESGAGQEGSTIGSDTLTKWIRECYDDDSIEAIVMRVNSPGGSGIASDNIWREVINSKAHKKPFVVSMSDVAASGGYYISMGADAIFADKTTLTGSIGVISGKFYINGLFEKLGIHYDVIKKAENADLFSSITHFTDEQEEMIKNHMEYFYDVFITKAAEGRKLTKQEIDSVGRGRVWTGEQAKEHKLIDQIGNLEDAINYAKKLAKIPEKEQVKLIIYPRKKNFWEEIMELDFNESYIKDSALREYFYIKHLISTYSKEPYLALMPDIKISR